MGYKDRFGDGVGLLTRSQQDGSEGIIYIAINYRLGLFVRPTIPFVPANSDVHLRGGSLEQPTEKMFSI